MKQIPFLLNLSHILYDGLFETIPLLLSFIILAFHGNEKEAGMIISLAIMASTFGGMATPLLTKTLPPLAVISLTIFLSGVSFLFSGFSQTIAAAGACFIMGAAGHSIYHNITFTFVAANSAKNSRGNAIGSFMAFGDIGRIPFTAFAGFVAASSFFGNGWQTVSFLYGLAAISLALFLCVFLSPFPAPLSTDQGSRSLPNFSLLRSPRHALPILASMLDAIGSDQLFAFLPYLLLAKGISPDTFAAFALCFSLGCCLGKFFCGKMVDRWGACKVFIIAEALMVLLTIWLIAEQSLFPVITAALLLGTVTKGTTPVIQTIIAEPITQPHLYSDIFTIHSFCRGSINILTPFAFGCLASSFGISWVYAIMAAAALAAIFPILILFLTPSFSYSPNTSQPSAKGKDLLITQ